MKINGETVEIKEGSKLDEFLVESGYDLEKIVVECNGEVLDKNSYCEIRLNNTDSYEIVSFVGGG